MPEHDLFGRQLAPVLTVVNPTRDQLCWSAATDYLEHMGGMLQVLIEVMSLARRW